MNNLYRQRITLALDYIEQHLDKTLPLDHVAQQSFFSPFHFHRIFRGVMNETLNNYIARRRVERAANLLVVKPNLSITDIALDCGFSSSANFAKAFKKHFGFSASNIRQPVEGQSGTLGAIVKKYGKSFNPTTMYPQHFGSTKEMERLALLVELTDNPLINLCTLASVGGYQPEAIFATWEQLIAWGEQQGITLAKQQRLALCFDNPAVTPIDKCRYQAALVVSENQSVDAPFIANSLPAGTYARLYIKGSLEQVEDAQKRLFSDWLPNSEFEPDNLPMIEHYLNDVRIDGFLEMNIMLKVKRMTN